MKKIPLYLQIILALVLGAFCGATLPSVVPYIQWMGNLFMSALVMMAIILNVVGLPPEGIGLVIGVDRILDMLRTAVNVYGDTCVAVLVGKAEGEKLTIDL